MVQQPKMIRILLIEKMQMLQLEKNARQRRANWEPTSTHSRSICVLNVEEPHIKLARLRPQSKIMRTDTSLFSAPRSPRTREGIPNSSMASKNMSKTVDALLFVLARRPTTYYQSCVKQATEQQDINKLSENTHQHNHE
jgi:hypothetical protein